MVKQKSIIVFTLLIAVSLFNDTTGQSLKDWKVQPLAQNHVEVYRSPDERNIF